MPDRVLNDWREPEWPWLVKASCTPWQAASSAALGSESLATVAAFAAGTTLGEAGDNVLTSLPALLTYLTTCSQPELLQQPC